MNFKYYYILPLILLCFITQLFSTEVQGVLNNTTTFTKNNSPYIVTGDIVVPIDATLIIEPGVEIQFKADDELDSNATYRNELIVYGTLIAIGTINDSIIFSTIDTATNRYYCYHIKIVSETASASIEYCQFMETEYGLHLYHSDSLYIKNNLFFENNRAIYIDNSYWDNDDTCFIYNNDFINCYYGIYFEYSNVFIHNNNFIMTSYPIYSSDGYNNYIDIRYNIFYSYSSAIYINHNNYLNIVNNTFWGKSKEHSTVLYVRHYYDYSVLNLNINSNIFINNNNVLDIPYDTENVSITQNCFYNNNLNANSYPDDSNKNIYENPNISDTILFKLEKPSPCIRTGLNGLDIGAVTFTDSLTNLTPVIFLKEQYFGIKSETLIIDGSYTKDANNDSLIFTWTLLTNNTNDIIYLGSISEKKWDFQTNSIGKYKYLFTVTDTEGLSDSLIIEIDIYDKPAKYGKITSPETWSGEIIITGDLKVETELTILPNTNIYFFPKNYYREYVDNGLCDLIISSSGYLNLLGCETGYINFLSTSEIQLQSQWGRLKIDNSKNQVIEYCQFESAKRAIVSSSSHHKIKNCIFKNNKYGIYAKTTKFIENNFFIGNEYGIQIENYYYNERVVIRNNIFFQDTTGIKIDHLSPVNIINNVFHNNKEYAISMMSSYYKTDIINNIFSDNITALEYSHKYQCLYNNFYNNETNWNSGDTPDIYYEYNPQYNDINSYDFTLKESSPIKQKGLGNVEIGLSDYKINYYTSNSVEIDTEIIESPTLLIFKLSYNTLIQLLPWKNESNNLFHKIELNWTDLSKEGYFQISLSDSYDVIKNQNILEYDSYKNTIFQISIFDTQYQEIDFTDWSDNIDFQYYPKTDLYNVFLFHYDNINKKWDKHEDRRLYISDNYFKSPINQTGYYGIFPVIKDFSNMKNNLTNAGLFPNPYRPNDGNRETGQSFLPNSYETGINFFNLTPTSIVYIYSITGHLVQTLSMPNTDGLIHWNVKNKSRAGLSTGFYLYIIKDENNNLKKGKFAVIK